MYTTEEKVWMVRQVAAGHSYREVSELFHTAFPNCTRPSHTMIMRMNERFTRTGNVHFHRAGAHQHRRTSTMELAVLASVHTNPHASSCEMAAMTGTSQRSVFRFLHKHTYKSYKIHLSQELRPGDVARRLDFAQTMLEQCDEEPDFVRNILFTDEAGFNLNCTPNKQNVRMWARENPREVYPAHTQYPGRVNVWAGMLNGSILGPIVIDSTLMGETYLALLENEISAALAKVDPGAELWWMHDGCLSHNYGPAKDFLHAAFPHCVIGTNENPIAWPARSPDANPCDYILWGHIESRIYQRQNPFRNVQDLRTAIEDCCAQITNGQLAAV